MISLALTGSVGHKGVNRANDVRLAIALLNTYARRNRLTEVTMATEVSDPLLTLIESFQKERQKATKPDRQIGVNGATFKGLVAELKASFVPRGLTKPTAGVLTWDAEGQEGGPYHSRILHVPSSASGLTIGRGYDMKMRSAAAISADLTWAGLTVVEAQKVSLAAGKSGTAAARFVIDSDLLDFEISPQVQLKLFTKVYADYEAQVKTICAKSDTVKAYGKVDWDKLHEGIKTMLVDLLYRGDYTPSSRKLIQSHVAANDFAKFKAVMVDGTHWTAVPALRQQQRVAYLNSFPEPAKADDKAAKAAAAA